MTADTTAPVQTIEDLPQAYNAAADLLGRNLTPGRSERVAYIDTHGAWTYAQLGARADRAAGLLKSLGVQREQRVLLCLLDTIDFPALFLGAIKAGIVPVPVNTLFTAEDYSYLLKDCRAPIAFVSEALAPKFAGAEGSCPNLKRVIVTGKGAGQLDALLADATPLPGYADTARDEPAFWLYTSGSTGRPKGAVHVHASLRLTADTYSHHVLKICPEDTGYSVAKLFFAYGLGNALTFPMSVGASTVLLDDRPTPALVGEILKKHNVSILYAVPTFFGAFLAHEGAPAKRDVPYLRRATSAGEALPEAMARRFKERYGVDILDGLGSTEMLHIFISQRENDIHYGATGKPVPGYEVKLLREDGSEAGDGEIGDLVVRGPTAATSYWNNRPKSRATFTGEWTRTGDKYIRDEAGWYRYGGRSDDMLKVSGIYVSPFDVEEALIGHDSVLEAAVVGWVDESGLTKPKAFVVCREESQQCDALARALQDHVKSCLAPHAYPRWIEFVSELPKTATGKLQRFRLRQE